MDHGLSSGFAFFPKLPPEIRSAIWTLYLPRRVLTVEWMFAGRSSHAPRQSSFTGYMVPIPFPPVVSHMCREVCEQAKRGSHHLETYASRRVMLFVENWLQPRLDILYLRWPNSSFDLAPACSSIITTLLNNARNSGALYPQRDSSAFMFCVVRNVVQRVSETDFQLPLVLSNSPSPLTTVSGISGCRRRILFQAPLAARAPIWAF